DGRYFYMFLTEEGSLVKVDLSAKKVVQRLEIGGKLAMGSFVVSHGQRDSGRRDSGQRDSGRRDSGQRDSGQHDSGRRGHGRSRRG
ncbi:MAG: hypothetical protein LGB68_05510, partial [Sulfurovum sp.]|nr:hypothetical protein [Sulfurovum sp.]